MKEGKSKLEESAIIVQEVAKELKSKDEKLQEIAAKLVQSIYMLDGKVNEQEATTQEVLGLADVSRFQKTDESIFTHRSGMFCFMYYRRSFLKCQAW